MARRFAPALAVAAFALCTLHATPAFAAKCIAVPSSAKGCSKNGDCKDDLICAGGRCVEYFSFDVITDCDLCPVTASDDPPCNTDANCTGSDGCINGFCRELQPVATDIDCTTDSDCTSGFSCIEATCQLVACGGVAGIDVGPGSEDDIEQELLDSAVPTTGNPQATDDNDAIANEDDEEDEEDDGCAASGNASRGSVAGLIVAALFFATRRRRAAREV